MKLLPANRLSKFLLPILLAVLISGLSWWYDDLMIAPASARVQPATTIDAATIPATASHVGRAVCANCHAEEHKLWQDSHHDLAMQEATGQTVLGDFNNREFIYFDVASRFYRDGKRFMVHTDGPDGTLQDFEIKYTFGVEPLQQYLIELSDGRLQALSIAWDARLVNKGGQRWFHLYPDEHIDYTDELHWTGLNQNWNFMCAECHSTNLRKNYDPRTRSYKTAWSEIDVSCEACHGPGSRHVAWAEHKPGWDKLEGDKGLEILFDERTGVSWEINPDTGNSTRSTARAGKKEIEMCARCHARRSNISAGYVHGERLLDHYRMRLLDEGMYFPDGQIEDEVYVYGSFIQSKMYHAGVTCSDCHQPHSLKLRSPGNGVCLQCHSPQKFDTSSHHFHKAGSKGASCAECHMSPRTYMKVDPRHDHSIRIPQPDQSVKLGTPNACTQCHQDRDAIWAAKQTRAWYGDTPDGMRNYAKSLAAGRAGDPSAGEMLASLIRDESVPAIARATALSEISAYLNRDSLGVLQRGLSDKDPMLRIAALELLERLPIKMRVPMAFPLLDDPVRGVRIQAAQVLAKFPAGGLDKDQQTMLDKATQESIEAHEVNADRPEAQVNLGNLYARHGEADKAKVSYETAIKLNPAFIPAYVNLAELHRQLQDETSTERVLRQAIAAIPGSADAHHALGLSLIRQKQTDKAVLALQTAATLNPDNPRYVYVYAVALNSTSKSNEAMMVLQGAHNRHPDNAEILTLLVSILRNAGNERAAQSYANKLRVLQGQGESVH